MAARIAIAVFEDVEELDFVGPWEVLRTWQRHWPDDGADVFTVTQRAGTVTCAKGLKVEPDVTWADAGTIDVLVCTPAVRARGHRSATSASAPGSRGSRRAAR